ncbi:hypothetical protein [Nocardia asiatica]|uniref:hypothetical protein n=1 Tax=Nocardia asiatica TaxID=209252 RepID=UPI002456BEDF|nr:hypothetical protein [Nocardia asiatica]
MAWVVNSGCGQAGLAQVYLFTVAFVDRHGRQIDFLLAVVVPTSGERRAAAVARPRKPVIGDFIFHADPSYRAPAAASGSQKPTTAVAFLEYQLRAYVHNGANDRPENIARDTRMRFALPDFASSTVGITSKITASNAVPDQVWDTVVLHNPKPFRVEMVPGSARMYNNTYPSDGMQVPGRVATGDGALIGSVTPDGNFAGNYQNSGIVTIKVKVIPA